MSASQDSTDKIRPEDEKPDDNADMLSDTDEVIEQSEPDSIEDVSQETEPVADEDIVSDENDYDLEESEDFDDEDDSGLDFWERHGIPREAATGLLSVVAAMACGIAIVMAFSAYGSKKSEKAEIASRDLQRAQSIEEIQKVADEYGSSEIMALSTLKTAQLHYSAGNFSQARTAYDTFLTDHPEHGFRSTAEMGLLICTESEGQVEAALQGYADFEKTNPGSHLVPEALFGRGRCLEQLGRKEDAKALYEEYLVNNPESLWVGRAERALELVVTDIRRAQGKL
jgi:tetratricopeptide (TPR) repeat protein